MPGVAAVVRPFAHRQSGLGGDENVMALASECLTDDVLRLAQRIEVRGVDHVDATIQTEIDLSFRFVEAHGTERNVGILEAVIEA